MKPGKIVVFLLSIVIIVGLVVYLNPYKELKITENFSIKFPHKTNTLPIDSPEIEHLSFYLDSSDTFELADTSIALIDSVTSKIDTIIQDSVSKKEKAVKSKIGKKFKYKLQTFEYPNDDSTLLYSFFRTIGTCNQDSSLIRILHYGDSQIEGDRVTNYIRYHLQKQFGGMGTGLFPVKLVNKNYISLHLEVSNNWDRYTYYSYRKGNLPYNRIGAMLAISRFTRPQNVINPSQKTHEGIIYLNKSQLSYSLNRNFKQCRIFYGHNKTPLISEVGNKNKVIDAELLAPSSSVQVLNYHLDKFPDGLRISFKGQDSPDIYGIALDGYKGVAMDNISLRGSKGLEFTKINLANLQQMYDLLNVKLLVMQFGVNVVPTLKKNYDSYEDSFYKQLVLLKSILPDIQIIVIGISDMSKKENGEMVTYPNVELIRDAQKNACFKANCVFWDSYEAMGGRNSMPAWVNHKPPLGQVDHTHFSYEGAKVVARMFYDAFMHDYNKFEIANGVEVEN